MQQNSLKNQYLSHLSSENCEINSIKSDLSRAFQQHQEHPKVPIQFSVSILFNFHGKNGSIINSFHTANPNILKPHQCIPYYIMASFLKIPRAWHEKHHGGLGNLRVQNKTNYSAS
jgi:hypothetical protein